MTTEEIVRRWLVAGADEGGALGSGAAGPAAVADALLHLAVQVDELRAQVRVLESEYGS